MAKNSDYRGETFPSADERYPYLCLFARQHAGNKERLGAGCRQTESIFIEGSDGDVNELADPDIFFPGRSCRGRWLFFHVCN